MTRVSFAGTATSGSSRFNQHLCMRGDPYSTSAGHQTRPRENEQGNPSAPKPTTLYPTATGQQALKNWSIGRNQSRLLSNLTRQHDHRRPASPALDYPPRNEAQGTLRWHGSDKAKTKDGW